MSDPFSEFGGKAVDDPFAEFGGSKEVNDPFVDNSVPISEMIPEEKEKTIIGDIKNFFKSPSWENLSTIGDDTPTASAISGGLKSGYFGLDDNIVGALGGEAEKAKYKEKQDRLEKLNSKSFLTGELASGLATPMGAVTALKMAPKAVVASSPMLSKLATRMGVGAAQGGLAGYGYGDDEGLEGAGLGATVGTMIPGVGGLLGAGKRGLNKMGVTGKNMFKLASGLDDVEYDVARNKDLSTTKTPEQMGAFYQDILDALQKNVGAADQTVKSSMTKLDDLANVPGVGRPLEGVSAFGGAMPDAVTPPPGTLSRSDIAQALQNLIKGDDKFPGLADFRPKTGEFEFKNSETPRVLNQLQKQVNQSLKGMEEFIPEDRVMGMVDEITSSINYDKDSKLKEKILKGFGSRVKGQVYSQNPRLKEAKEAAQKAIELQDTGKQLFSPSTEWEGNEKFFLPSDTTKRVEGRILNPESFETKRFAGRVKEATGLDLEDEALKRYVKESTSGGTPTGFLDRYGIQKGVEMAGVGGLGMAAGSAYGMEGSGAGMGAGLALGLLRQKYGKRIGAGALQQIRKYSTEKQMSPTSAQMRKLAEEYAKGGNKRLAATYFVLSQRNQNLREEKGE